MIQIAKQDVDLYKPLRKNMKLITLTFALLLSLTISIRAQAAEKAVYVGEGRYSCQGESMDCAVLKQRNQEQTQRTRERNEYERRNEEAERREREYRRDYDSGRDSGRY